MKWATSVPILVFLGLSVLDLGPTYATDVRRQTDRRQTNVRQHHRFIPPTISGGGIIVYITIEEYAARNAKRFNL